MDASIDIANAWSVIINRNIKIDGLFEENGLVS